MGTPHTDGESVELSNQILGLINWGRNTPKWWGIDFHQIPLEERPEYLDLALQRFEDMYNDSPKHLWMSDGRVKFRLDKGRTMAKMKKEGRIYAFVDINMSNDPERYGGLMKPASWKAPDKKKYIRAHLFAENPLRGAGWSFVTIVYYSGAADTPRYRQMIGSGGERVYVVSLFR